MVALSEKISSKLSFPVLYHLNNVTKVIKISDVIAFISILKLIRPGTPHEVFFIYLTVTKIKANVQ
jgi:hypothetical protein